jgi:hypothetical protein
MGGSQHQDHRVWWLLSRLPARGCVRWPGAVPPLVALPARDSPVLMPCLREASCFPASTRAPAAIPAHSFGNECDVSAARMSHRNVQSDASTRPPTRSRYKTGRVRPVLGMLQLAPLVLVRLDLARAQLTPKRRAPPTRRHTAAWAFVRFRRSTLLVLVAVAGPLTGATVPPHQQGSHAHHAHIE